MKRFKVKHLCFAVVFLLIISFFILEYSSYMKIYADESTVLPSTKEHGAYGLPKPSLKAYIGTYLTNNNKVWSILDVYVENENSDKKPILLLGNEVAIGLELEREESLSYKLAKATGRPVYNQAINLPAMPITLHQVRNEKFYEEIPKPEYIIFTLSRSCNIGVYRPYVYQLARFNPSIYYKVKDGSLVEDKLRPYLLRSTSYFWYRASEITYSEPTEQMLNVLGLYFLEIRKAIESHWGNDVKFVVVAHDKVTAIEKIQPLIDFLANNNFTVIDINKASDVNLYNEEYLFPPSNWHPNGKGITKLTELIVKQLGI